MIQFPILGLNLRAGFPNGAPGSVALRILSLLLTTLAGFVLGQPAEAASRYRLTNLGLLNSDWTGIGEAVNDAGVVVGSSINFTDNGGWSGVRWTQNRGLQDLKELSQFVESKATSINASGQIVGNSWTFTRDVGTFGHAFLWSADRGMTDLGVLPGTALSTAWDINGLGQVVGESQYVRSHLGRAFIWSESEGMSDLGLMLGFEAAAASAINDSGAVVGYTIDATTQLRHAFLWTRSGGFEDLGQNVYFSSAWDINNHGVVVGDAGTNAFIWTSAGGMIELTVPTGYVGSSARGINDLGEIVGTIHPRNDQGRAAIWTSADGFQDLNALVDESGVGWILRYASGINNLGQIVGTGHYTNGQGAIFLLSPVPEPGSAALLGLAAVLLTVRPRTRS